MPSFVYLLHSQSLGCYYIGQTSDLARRLKAHNAGLARTTKRGRPWSLLGYEIYANRSDARWQERQLKLHSDRKASFIKRLQAKGR